MASRRRFRSAVSLFVAAAVAAGLLVAVVAGPAAAQTVADVEARDRLIANQENLLNTYRCLFGVDVDVVPGGCPDPDVVAPGVSPDSPTQGDVDVRDGLIGNQEALLNIYRCRFDVDTEIVPGGCLGVEPAADVDLPPAAWQLDPTCRNVWRWWDGQRWADEVGNGGVMSFDPLQSGEDPPPPVEGGTRDCPGPAYPLTEELLGCDDVFISSPACEIGGDGWPVATRLMSYDEVADTGFYDVYGLLSEVRPVSVSDEVALGYITECLAEWPEYQFSPYEADIIIYRNKHFTATPVSICNALWRLPVVAIDHMGADVRCVWDRFKAYFLHLEPRYSDYEYSLPGWAEACESWLDPVPELRFLDKCISLLQRISQELYDALGLGNATASCTFTEDTYEIHDRRGRCAHLESLNNLSRRFKGFAEDNGLAWDETQVMPEIPDNSKFIC